MTYSTKQNLIDRFGATELQQLTDRTNIPPSTIDDIVLGEALSDADALLDSYIAKRYSLPLDPVPSILTRMSGDIARFYLYGKRADKDGEVERAYKEAMAWAKDVARGLVELEQAGQPAEQTGGGTIRTEAPAKTFSRDSLKGM